MPRSCGWLSRLPLLLSALLWLLPIRCPAIPLAAEYRSLDGTSNNLDQPTWGCSGSLYRRHPPYRPRYGPDNSSMVTHLPNPRLISNAISAVSRKLQNPRLVNDMHTNWGLFIHADLMKTPDSSGEEARIPVPACDPYLDWDCTGNVTIPFNRTLAVLRDGARQQVNEINSFIDGSMIYGSDPVRAAALRTFAGGKLRTNEHGEPPLNTANLYEFNPVRRNSSQLRLMGDPRTNLSPHLLVMTAVFLREHNRYCDALGQANPSWSDETLFQESRRRVVAHLQHITYMEYLPALLGKPLPLYAGYNDSVDPTTDNFFAACAMRYGHPEVKGVILRLTPTWSPTRGGTLLLRDVYFNPAVALSEGIEPLLRGMLYAAQWDVEVEYESDLRNYLFQNPVARVRPMDLLALNIQRGRDHGLPGYNAARRAFGLPPRAAFSHITSNPAIAAALQQVYADVDDIDPIVGGLAEDHDGGNIGGLMAASIRDQFERTRAGDRLWYQNGQFEEGELQEILNTRLVDILNRNADLQYAYDRAMFREDAQLDGGAFSADMPYLPALETHYPARQELHRGYRLYWAVDAAHCVVHFAAQAHGQGWVGLGLSQYDAKQPLHSAMYHVDMTLGRLADGAAVVDDRFSIEYGVPSRDVDLGCHDDLTGTSLEVHANYRVLRFTKPFTSPDSQEATGRLRNSDDVVKMAEVFRCDTPLVVGREYLVTFAANPVQDALVYHGAARGFTKLLLIPEPTEGGPSLAAIGTATAGGVGLGLLLLAAVVVYRRRRGKSNACAPRRPPLCILFTDIEQSTMLWSLNEAVMAHILEQHTAIIRRVLAAHRAFEVKTIGDSFMVAVKDPRTAVAVAVDIQLQLFRASWGDDVLNLVAEAVPDTDTPQALPSSSSSAHLTACTRAWNGPRVRIGIHYADKDSGVIAEVDRVSGGYDYFGNPVNVAARIESLAHGGQILVSRAVLEACPELRSDPNVRVEPLGEVRVKGVPHPVEVAQVTPLELADRAFPPLRDLSFASCPIPLDTLELRIDAEEEPGVTAGRPLQSQRPSTSTEGHLLPTDRKASRSWWTPAGLTVPPSLAKRCSLP